MSEKLTREVLEGVVRSAKAQKTVTVLVPLVVKHPLYGKFIRKNRVFRVHDERGEAREGDRVEIIASRPISKTKHWRLRKIIERAQTV